MEKSKNFKNIVKKFPKSPGVYLVKNAQGEIIYIGKATSLRDRLASYFERPNNFRVETMIRETSDIEFKKIATVIEALILEANLIKKHQPKYNVKEKDDKSFLCMAFSNETFPRLMLLRGSELRKIENKKFKIKKAFGPFTSASSFRAALDILRKIFPYRDCVTFPKRPCLQYHLKRCPAPCVGLISKSDYQTNIKNLILFFEGRKKKIIKSLKRQMVKASEKENFEEAIRLRNQIFALEHICDVAVIKNDGSKEIDYEEVINVFGRIEGYDISNINGQNATGSMVVFISGKPNKGNYRKFRIKTVQETNDVAMLKEVITRRLQHTKIGRKVNLHFDTIVTKSRVNKIDLWPLPDLIIIDGGQGQINAIYEVLTQHKVKIPVIGVVKGFDRKQDRLIYDKRNLELDRIAKQYKDLFLRVRDEAHRFAIGYHRLLRKKELFRD